MKKKWRFDVIISIGLVLHFVYSCKSGTNSVSTRGGTDKTPKGDDSSGGKVEIQAPEVQSDSSVLPSEANVQDPPVGTSDLPRSTKDPVKSGSETNGINYQDSSTAIAKLKSYLQSDTWSLDGIVGSDFSRIALAKSDAQDAINLIWSRYAETSRRERSQEISQGMIALKSKVLKFKTRNFGKEPADGHSLYISMHGGGSAPASTNDSQWENQINLYSPSEGIYLAPRAPIDAWNMWFIPEIDPLFDRLISDYVIAEGVNPNRVYLIGYSAGGDGVYQLGTRSADRWAAATMCAGHPNDASPLNLRNLPFAVYSGANDSEFNRNAMAKDWLSKMDDLNKNDPSGYIHTGEVFAGLGHWMNGKEAVAIPWMAGFTRNPFPGRVVFRQTPVPRSSFYWISVDPDSFKPGSELDIQYERQKFTFNRFTKGGDIVIRLSDRMVDLDMPVEIVSANRSHFKGTPKRTIEVIAKTIKERSDPSFVFTSEIKVAI
ncbi:MAG: alpha/beta hydrolase [Oligoflexales bacterium]|nr:alpha/beta hydrolase [Oligoflexales bacterium]